MVYLYSFSALDIELFAILLRYGTTPTSLRIYECSLRCLRELGNKAVFACAKLVPCLTALVVLYVSLHLQRRAFWHDTTSAVKHLEDNDSLHLSSHAKKLSAVINMSVCI